MNSLLNQNAKTGEEPLRRRQVEVATTELHQAVSENSMLVGEIESRFAPVLMPQSCTENKPVNPSGPAAVMVGLASNVSDAAITIRRNNELLQQILLRAEL
jgi:hypothetical protein